MSWYQAAMKLPKTTPEEVAERQAAMDKALRNAIEIPMGLMRILSELWDPLKILAPVFNLSTASDLQVIKHFKSLLLVVFTLDRKVMKILIYFQVGVRCLDTAIAGAHDIVMLNLMDLKDEELSKASKLMVERSKKNTAEILDIVAKRLKN